MLRNKLKADKVKILDFSSLSNTFLKHILDFLVGLVFLEGGDSPLESSVG